MTQSEASIHLIKRSSDSSVEGSDCIEIIDKQKVAEEVLPTIFKHENFSSFVKQVTFSPNGISIRAPAHNFLLRKTLTYSFNEIPSFIGSNVPILSVPI
jgi:hypothetical protein